MGWQQTAQFLTLTKLSFTSWGVTPLLVGIVVRYLVVARSSREWFPTIYHSHRHLGRSLPVPAPALPLNVLYEWQKCACMPSLGGHGGLGLSSPSPILEHRSYVLYILQEIYIYPASWDGNISYYILGQFVLPIYLYMHIFLLRRGAREFLASLQA